MSHGYNACPACNGKRETKTAVAGVATCNGCGAIHGTCYKGDSYSLVLPQFTTDPAADERVRYYDLTVLGSKGIERRHGWYDPQTKLITQTG